jgi:hypothetical protein
LTTGRLLAISDLHVGYPQNRAYAEELSPGDPGDWLIVAGDVGESFTDVGFTLASLTRRFARVIWTPGNHELWTLPSDAALPRRHGSSSGTEPPPVPAAPPPGGCGGRTRSTHPFGRT